MSLTDIDAYYKLNDNTRGPEVLVMPNCQNLTSFASFAEIGSMKILLKKTVIYMYVNWPVAFVSTQLNIDFVLFTSSITSIKTDSNDFSNSNPVKIVFTQNLPSVVILKRLYRIVVLYLWSIFYSWKTTCTLSQLS